MGGGATMRAASKVSGFSFNGGFRSSPFVTPPEQPLNLASKKPIAIEGGKSTVAISSQISNSDASTSVQKPSWEIDDWEFSIDDEEIYLDSMNSVPRVVFGGVPTLEEAKEATLQLKDALDMVYFCDTNATSWKKSSTVVQESVPGYPEACIIKGSGLASPPLPEHVCQAFSLLNQSREAQSAVASIASDENVWNAVMQNKNVMEFLKLMKSSPLSRDMEIMVNEPSTVNHDNYETLENSVDDGNAKDSNGSGNAFIDILNKVKLSIMEMLNSLSGLFESIFGGPGAGGIPLNIGGNATESNVDRTMGATFMAFGILAILVVLLTRGETAFRIQLAGINYINFIHRTAHT